jgi:hypothetical protein
VSDPAPTQNTGKEAETSGPGYSIVDLVFETIEDTARAILFWGLLGILLLTLGAVGLLVGLHFALRVGYGVEWPLVLLLLLYSAWVTKIGGIWTDWVPRRRVRGTDWVAPLARAWLSLFVLTASFAGLTAALAAHGWLETDPMIGSRAVGPTVAHYTWHFLGAIPVLDIPDTLNWTLGTTFTDLGSGALLLVYKLLVIIPVVRAIVEIIDQRRGVGQN